MYSIRPASSRAVHISRKIVHSLLAFMAVLCTCDSVAGLECLASEGLPIEFVQESSLPEDWYSDFPVYHEVAKGSLVAVCVVSREAELLGLKIALLTILQLQV